MWSGVLGFLITLLVGYIASFILFKISPKIYGNSWEKSVSEEQMFTKSNENNTTIDDLDKSLRANLPNPDLFTPLLASKIKKQNDQKIANTNVPVSSLAFSI